MKSLSVYNVIPFFFAALVVRFLTKRFIGEYVSGQGNLSTVFISFYCLVNEIFPSNLKQEKLVYRTKSLFAKTATKYPPPVLMASFRVAKVCEVIRL